MNELKVLESIIRAEKKESPLCTKLWFKFFLLLLLLTTSYYMSVYFHNGGTLLSVKLVSFFLGAFIVKNIIDEQAFKAWLHMKGHIDQESIKKRIDEIKNT